MKNIEIKERFILEALRSTGYDAYSAIYELIDNAIDAGASSIKINYENDILTIKDNGIGMSLNKLQESMNIGCDRTYATNEIGYFGVGLKSSSLNLINLDKNGSILIKTNDGVEKTVVEWFPIENPLLYSLNSTENVLEEGTEITINKPIKFQKSALKKNLGTIYYPTLKRDIIEIFVNNIKITPNDPLYRDSNLTSKNYVVASVNNHKINVETSLIDQSQEKHHWDRKEKRNNDEKWSYAKGGIYIIYGGRYIDYGGTFGLKNNDPWDSRTRIEFELPKELTTLFGLKFNKTNGIKLNDNDALHDLVVKLKGEFNWASNKRKKDKPQLSDDEKREIEDVTEKINKSVPPTWKINRGKTTKTPINKEDEDKPKELVTNKPPTPPRKLKTPKLFDVKVENLGSTSQLWTLGYEKNIFVITLNESHVFYREIYRNMNKSGREDVLFLLASMAYVQHNISFSSPNFSEEYFWEDYWSEVSLKLKHLLNSIN